MPDEANWLRERLEELERIERPSASDGERRAAEWLVAQLAELGAEARIEAEAAHGTYWWPLGIGAALGALGAVAALRGRRLLGTLLGRRRRRRRSPTTSRPASAACAASCPRRTTYNVVCELGDPDAERTVVLIAHHDAAHSGLVFHPAMPELADRLGLLERTDTSPPLMAPVVGGPRAGRARRPHRPPRCSPSSASCSASARSRRWPTSAPASRSPAANDNGTAVVALLGAGPPLPRRAARRGSG